MSSKLLKVTLHFRTFVTALSHIRELPSAQQMLVRIQISHTSVTLLGAPKVRFICVAQSPQSTDLKLSIHSVLNIYYRSSGKNSMCKYQDRWDREGLNGCNGPCAEFFDFFVPINSNRSTFLFMIFNLQ